MSALLGVQQVGYLLALGDDALIATQRLAEWTGSAPELEEDVALSNIALDQLGAARMLLSAAGELEGAGRDEDALAFDRSEREFRNCQLVELPNGDFAVTIVKLLFLAAYQHELYGALRSSTDERLAAIAGKAYTETAYHLDHARVWTVRLGDGTGLAHERMVAALERVWPYTHDLFTPWAPTDLLTSGVAIDPVGLRQRWMSTVDAVLSAGTLDRPQDGGWAPTGGRDGVHTEAMGYLLAEMQYLHRSFPGASW